MPNLQTAFTSPEHKQQYVRKLFATIADRYDFITVVLSFGRDRAWKRRLAREARLQTGERVIDVACGTGDIAFEAARYGAEVIGLDVTRRMIELARIKAGLAKTDGTSASARSELQASYGEISPKRPAGREGGWPVPHFTVGDMMALPFADATADVVTTGYGLRNVPGLAEAIDEIARVLKPGGRLLSLDFNRPRQPLILKAYLGYLAIVGSTLGWLLHRDPDTYRYIPESLRRYPGAEGVADLLRAHGFADVRVVPIFGGFMTLHVARRAC